MENREVKFRVWDTKKKCFFKPIFEASNGRLQDMTINFNGELMMRTMEGTQHESTFKGRYILMQYTGLKDMNGKEIYVDFIYADSHGDLWLILDIGFCRGILCYRMKFLETGKIHPMDEGVETLYYKGNIYENPDLLTKT